MVSKLQSIYPYRFSANFHSDIRKIFEEESNAEIIQSIITQWDEYSIDHKAEDLEITLVESIKYGCKGVIKDGNLKTNSLFIVIKKIHENILKKLNFGDFNHDVLLRLLVGGFDQQYYSNGKNSELWYNALKEHSNKDDTNRSDNSLPLHYIRDQLIVHHLEESTEASKKDITCFRSITRFLEKISQGKQVELTENILKGAFLLGVSSDRILSFSDEGLDFAKHLLDKKSDLYKGLLEIRVIRKTSFNFLVLMVSIIASIYLKKELYLCFDPYFFKLSICDIENLPKSIHNNNPMIIMNFAELVHLSFCKHCLETIYQSNIFQQVSKKENKLSITQLQAMFQELQSIVERTDTHEVCINLTGKVKDTTKMDKLKEEVPFGMVGLDQYSGLTQGLVYNIEKTLKIKK